MIKKQKKPGGMQKRNKWPTKWLKINFNFHTSKKFILQPYKYLLYLIDCIYIFKVIRVQHIDIILLQIYYKLHIHITLLIYFV